jgi:uncharacterized protein YjaZ
MSIELHILNAPGRLTGQVRRITRSFKATAARVRQLLPIDSIDVVVQAVASLTIEETGVGGFSPTAELSFIYLNPSHERFPQSIDDEVGPTMAHELMHCARWGGPGYGTTLGEALVSEGLALHFETLFRTCPPIYARAHDEARLDELVSLARGQFDATDYGHADWFIGSHARAIPKYAGYAIGFHIVGRALDVLQCSVSDACRRPASEFLAV